MVVFADAAARIGDPRADSMVVEAGAWGSEGGPKDLHRAATWAIQYVDSLQGPWPYPLPVPTISR